MFIAIDIGTTNTAIRVETHEGKRILHTLVEPKTGWLNELDQHFTQATHIGVEKQVEMNAKARDVMKSVLIHILNLEKAKLLLPGCKWGTLSPRKKSPTSKHCHFIITECDDCVIGKSFHLLTNTKKWAINAAGHYLHSVGETDNPIFTSKKKDDLADVVIYCLMMRRDEKLIDEPLSREIALALREEMDVVKKSLVKRMTILNL